MHLLAPLLQSVYRDTTAIHEMQLNQAPAPNLWSMSLNTALRLEDSKGKTIKKKETG